MITLQQARQKLTNYDVYNFQQSKAGNDLIWEFNVPVVTKDSINAFVQGYKTPQAPYFTKAEMGYAGLDKFLNPYIIERYNKLRQEFNNPNYFPTFKNKNFDPTKNVDNENFYLSNSIMGEPIGFKWGAEQEADQYLQKAYSKDPAIVSDLKNVKTVGLLPDGGNSAATIPKSTKALDLVDNFINSVQDQNNDMNSSTPNYKNVTSVLNSLKVKYDNNTLTSSPILKSKPPYNPDQTITISYPNTYYTKLTPLQKYAESLEINNSWNFAQSLTSDILPMDLKPSDLDIKLFQQGYNSDKNSKISKTANGITNIVEKTRIQPLIDKLDALPRQSFSDPHIYDDLKKNITLKNINLSQDKNYNRGNEYIGYYEENSHTVPELEDVDVDANIHDVHNLFQNAPQTKTIQAAEAIINNVSYDGKLPNGDSPGYLLHPNTPAGQIMIDDYSQGVRDPETLAKDATSFRVKTLVNLQNQIKTQQDPSQKALDKFIRDKISNIKPDGSVDNKIGQNVIAALESGKTLSQLKVMLTPDFNNYLKKSADSLTEPAYNFPNVTDKGTAQLNNSEEQNLPDYPSLAAFKTDQYLKTLKDIPNPINNQSVQNDIDSDIKDETNRDLTLKNFPQTKSAAITNLNNWIQAEQDLPTDQDEEKQLHVHDYHITGNDPIAQAKEYEIAALDANKEIQATQLANQVSKEAAHASSVGANVGEQNYNSIKSNLLSDKIALQNDSTKMLRDATPSLTDKLVRDDLQLDAINIPSDRNAITNYFQLGASEKSYNSVTSQLESGVRSGNMTFAQMADTLSHDKDYSEENDDVGAFKQLNKKILVERDSQESLELAHQIDPNFKPENTKQLETNLSQGDLSRAGLENEVHLQQAVGHAIPLSKTHLTENYPSPYSLDKVVSSKNRPIVDHYEENHMDIHHLD